MGKLIRLWEERGTEPEPCTFDPRRDLLLIAQRHGFDGGEESTATQVLAFLLERGVRHDFDSRSQRFVETKEVRGEKDLRIHKRKSEEDGEPALGAPDPSRLALQKLAISLGCDEVRMSTTAHDDSNLVTIEGMLRKRGLESCWNDKERKFVVVKRGQIRQGGEKADVS